MFFKIPESPIKLTIRQSFIKTLKRGHPWVYATSLTALPTAKPGSFAVIRDASNNILAKGFYDPSCPIAFRVCSLEEPLNQELIQERIKDALNKRDSILSDDTNCCRLINGEGDLLPGLICDKFADAGVIQVDGEGPSNFWDLEKIAALIAKEADLNTIYLKPRSGSEDLGKLLFGTCPPTKVEFLEHGAIYQANLVDGQKTGFFLDQRENRFLIRSLSNNKSVLNLFGYTGGFSIAAGLGGADSVVTVDIAKPAINNAEINWQLNDLPINKHQAVSENAFDFLANQIKDKTIYDLIIVDPPSFVSSKAALEKGRGAYISIYSQAAQIVAAKGLLALSSCSSQVSPELFLEICEESIAKAKRRAIVKSITGQPIDHPFPLACQELQYLKFALFSLV